MAFSRTLVVSALFLLSVLFLHLTEAQQSGINEAASPLPQTIDCGAACEGRCKESSRPRLCERACGSCCGKCSCVPPGTSGNLETCPCYAALTTRNKIPKCP